MKSKDLINLTIKNEDYTINGNKVTCTLVCKLNLKELEQQSFYFTNGFIHKVLGKYLPIIKIIRKETDDIYKGIDDIAAKYYLQPGKKAKVIYFDNDYFNKIRNHDNPYYQNRKMLDYKPGDIIPMKKVCNAAYSMHESTTYEYCETFKVQASAVCCKGDTFNLDIGKNLALTTAMILLNNTVKNIYDEILERMNSVSKKLEYAISDLYDYNVELTNMLN